jgi:hypothetical protein
MSNGTFLRGEDGSLYFIRDEVLEACKVEGEHLERSEAMLDSDGDAEVEGFAFHLGAAPQLKPIKYVQAPDLNAGAAHKLQPDLGAVQSTVMCPW